MEHVSDRSIVALLLGTLSIAALHALIPSHWLAFALVGRAQRWTIRRTLTVTALAGTGHVMLTILLGLLIAGAGKKLLQSIPPQTEHAATAILLILLGVYFAYPALRGRWTGCNHPAHVHSENGEESSQGIATPGSIAQRIGTAPTVMGALVLGMTLSPCLDLLSVYVAASALSWSALAAISLIMAGTTVGLMVLLVWLTLLGLQRLNLKWVERNEGLIVGGTLIALGILLFFLK